MTAAVLGLYYLLAAGVLALVVRHAAGQNARDAEAAFSQLRAGLSRWESSPPMPPPLPADATTLEPASLDRATGLEPIAPLLERFVQEYLDRPMDREQLARSLADALAAGRSA